MTETKTSGTDRLIGWLDNYKNTQQEMQEEQQKVKKEQDNEKFRRIDLSI